MAQMKTKYKLDLDTSMVEEKFNNLKEIMMNEETKVFQYVIIYHPVEEEKSSEMAMNGFLIADSRDDALVKLGILIPVERRADMDGVEVLIRPF